MRMSEFDRSENNKREDCPFFSIHRSVLPDDFTEEDLTFAAELHTLFSPEEEKLPPYYVQTLLDVDDQRFEPAVRGFEYKTNARVFRRLKLRRRLFRAHTSPLSALSLSLGDVSLRRSALTMVSTFILIMLLTVAFTGSSFATGVAILLRGTHGSGVYLTNKFPSLGVVHPPHGNSPDDTNLAPKQISQLMAQQQLHFPIYWPNYSLPGYMLQRVNLYVGLDQQWADGPMLEFEYSRPSSSSASGLSEVWVREFLPRTDVLQVVQVGASSPVDDNENGALAIYVDGQWSSDMGDEAVWMYGGRSELVYQINGVVFWIAGDQRDGVGEKELLQVARGLTLYTITPHIHVPGDMTPVTQMSVDPPGPFSTDVIIVLASDSGGEGGPFFFSVTSSQPPKHAH